MTEQLSKKKGEGTGGKGFAQVYPVREESWLDPGLLNPKLDLVPSEAIALQSRTSPDGSTNITGTLLQLLQNLGGAPLNPLSECRYFCPTGKCGLLPLGGVWNQCSIGNEQRVAPPGT